MSLALEGEEQGLRGGIQGEFGLRALHLRSSLPLPFLSQEAHCIEGTELRMLRAQLQLPGGTGLP